MIGTLTEIAAAVGGKLSGGGDTRARGACIDSRSLTPSDVFFALVAQRDGHEYVSAAARAGASAVVVSRAVDVDVPTILVPDTLVALQALGEARRRAVRARVVALTGSCGKTTTRELVAAALGAGGPVHQSRGNLNNHLGVPLTLIGLTPEHAFCVVEMGANHPGEIAMLTRLADPDVGLVTCVAEAHTEFFGGLEGVARAKGELFAGMRRDAVAVVNLDDAGVRTMSRASERTVTYGTCEEADVRLLGVMQSPEGGQRMEISAGGARIVTRLGLSGAHNALNAVAALAVCEACGVRLDIAASRLCDVEPVQGRGASLRGARLEIIDDTYNANPASMHAGLSTLVARAAGRRTVAVLGDMFELGEASPSLHRKVGKDAASMGVAKIVAVGARAGDVRGGAIGAGAVEVECFESTEEALGGLGSVLREGDLVLVKGSRGMKMERVVQMLLYW